MSLGPCCGWDVTKRRRRDRGRTGAVSELRAGFRPNRTLFLVVSFGSLLQEKLAAEQERERLVAVQAQNEREYQARIEQARQFSRPKATFFLSLRTAPIFS